MKDSEYFKILYDQFIINQKRFDRFEEKFEEKLDRAIEEIESKVKENQSIITNLRIKLAQVIAIGLASGGAGSLAFNIGIDKLTPVIKQEKIIIPKKQRGENGNN